MFTKRTGGIELGEEMGHSSVLRLDSTFLIQENVEPFFDYRSPPFYLPAFRAMRLRCDS